MALNYYPPENKKEYKKLKKHFKQEVKKQYSFNNSQQTYTPANYDVKNTNVRNANVKPTNKDWDYEKLCYILLKENKQLKQGLVIIDGLLIVALIILILKYVI